MEKIMEQDLEKTPRHRDIEEAAVQLQSRWNSHAAPVRAEDANDSSNAAAVIWLLCDMTSC